MPDGSSAFREYQRLGVDVVQFQLGWDTVAPTRPAFQTDPKDPAYRWPAIVDQAVRAGRRRGIRVALHGARLSAMGEWGTFSRVGPGAALLRPFPDGRQPALPLRAPVDDLG